MGNNCKFVLDQIYLKSSQFLLDKRKQVKD